jgi:hypothetical protein
MSDRKYMPEVPVEIQDWFFDKNCSPEELIQKIEQSYGITNQQALVKCGQIRKEIWKLNPELVPENEKKVKAGCLASVIALFLLAVVIGLFMPDEDKKTSSSSSNTGLKLEAMKAVRYQLKDYSNANFIMSSVKTTKVDDKYYVIGEFDSKNAFGAKVRSTFAVEFIKNSGSGYEATYVEIK